MKWIKERIYHLRKIFILAGLALIGSCSSKNGPLNTLLSPIEQDLVGFWQFQSVVEEKLQVSTNTWTTKTWTVNDCLEPSAAGQTTFYNFYFYDNADGYYATIPQGKILRTLSTCTFKYGGDMLWKISEELGKTLVIVSDRNPTDVVLKYEILNLASFKNTNQLELKLVYAGGQVLTRILTYQLQRVSFNQHEKDDRPVSQKIVNNWKFKQLRDEGGRLIYDISKCSSANSFNLFFDDFLIKADNKVVQLNRCTSVTAEYSWSMATNPTSDYYLDLFQTSDATQRYVYGVQYIDKYQMLVRVVSSRAGLIGNYTIWFRNID